MMDKKYNFSEVVEYIKEGEGKDAKEILDQLDYPTDEEKMCSYQSNLTCVVIWLNREDVLREIVKRGWFMYGRRPAPLHTACALGKTEVVSLLLKHMTTADVDYDGHAFRYHTDNFKDSQYYKVYESPLYFALAHDDLDLFKLLYVHCANPLHYCCVQGAVKCADYLLNSGYSAFDTVSTSKGWLSRRRPLEIAIHTSVPLTKRLLEYEASHQVHRDALNSPNCNMLIHNVIASNTQHSVIKWRRGVMPSVVKLLIDHGVSVNGGYKYKTLIQIFFCHVLVYYETVYAKGSFSDVNVFFNELIESAEMVKQAGLDATRQQIFDTFFSHFKFGPNMCVDDMFIQMGEPHTKYLSEAFSRGVDLLFALWPNTTRQDGDLTFALLTNMLDASTKFIQKLTRQPEENHESFYQTMNSVLVRIFLDFPDIDRDGNLIDLPLLQRFMDSCAKGDSDDAKFSRTYLLLSLLLNFISTPRIYNLTVPKDYMAERLTLKNICRLAVIRHLSVTKTEKILQLPVPKTLKTYLLFECN